MEMIRVLPLVPLSFVRHLELCQPVTLTEAMDFAE